MLRALVGASAALFGGYYLFGGMGGYSRVVDRSPDEVASALDDLDIREQPGSPGTDPTRSGGVRPVFSHARTADGITWTVRSGDDVAVTMTAYLTPIDDGKRTKVTTSIQRGNAPDDFVSPAFRSKGITAGLFGMALDSELDKLTAPPAADPAKCVAFFERFREDNQSMPDAHRQDNIRDAVGDVAATAMRLAAFQAEARRIGCPTDGGGDFEPVRSEMRPAQPDRGVSFVPGEPMIDPNPKPAMR
ncbi:hypothetical protein AB2M62_17345 [Sphingomonas sp. MMS12-HWE2-04]|uniref:hypothetical protein n=1 Tax=Sphingomonas sp. MMS12-HWE2-04 TaxID=3234199 RepID=UPI00384FCC7B